MRLETMVKKDCLLVKVDGELDMAVSPSFREQIEKVLDDVSANNIILDLKNVTFIDSSGLGVILGRYKRVATFGGKMAVVSPQLQVERILELSGILKIIPRFDTEEDALTALQGGNASV